MPQTLHLKALNPPANGSSFVPAGSLDGTSLNLTDLSHFFAFYFAAYQ